MTDHERLRREADRECEAADEMVLSGKGPGYTPARRAVRLYRQAARLAPEPERSRLFLRAAEVADVMELGSLVAAVVREACRDGDPDYETVERFRGLWECWGWAAAKDGGDAAFPEPPPANSRTLLDRKRPIPGQGEFFGGDAPSRKAVAP